MYDDAITFGQRQIKKNYRSVTGHFPSVKNNKSIGFESSLEKILFLYLEFDNTVETYREQPRIMIIKNGKSQKYDVDCFIKRYKKSNLKDALIEVKYLSEFEKNKDIYEKKFNAAKIRCDEIDVDFKFLTELDFNEIYISNIDFLYRFILHPSEDKYDDIILDKLKDNGFKDASFWYKNLIFDLIPMENKKGREIAEGEVLGAMKYLESIGKRVNVINVAEIVGCHPSIHKGFRRIYKNKSYIRNYK